jgi:ribonuclease T1
VSLWGRHPRQQLAYLLVALGLIGLVWWTNSGLNNGLNETTSDSAGTTSSSSSLSGSVDSESGLAWIKSEDLPSEAWETLSLIDSGGPYPFAQDDEVFGNFEELLPQQPGGYYREYTVITPGADTRGARRIVRGAEGELYWTNDHYRSFQRIVR